LAAMHEDQLDLTLTTVRRLIERQYPKWASLPVRPMSTAGP
jgi:hypothetical protein